MTNRNSLLGRSKPSEKLTGEQLAALDKATAPPVPIVPPAPKQPAKPPEQKSGGTQRKVKPGTC